MAKMNVSPPDPMKARAVARLQAAVTEGLESGAPRAFDAAALKARMRGLHDA